MTTQNLNRPNSGISTDSKNTGSTGKEVQPDASKCEGSTTAYFRDPTENDGVLDVAQNSSTAVDSLDEGSIRQDQTGYAGS